MPVTMDDVRAALDPEEPDYESALRLGADAIPFLEELIQGDDSLLASKAVYLASRIGGESGVRIIVQASQHADPTMRVAAAGAARYLSADRSSNLLARLVGDTDTGVRRTTLKTIASLPDAEKSPAIRSVLERTRDSDTDPRIRSLASELLRQ